MLLWREHEDRVELPDTPQASAVRITAEHEHLIASLDVDREHPQTVAEVGLVEADRIKPECGVSPLCLLEGLCNLLQRVIFGNAWTRE